MSARRGIWEVARRELTERSRSRAVRLSFAALLMLVVGGTIAIALIGKGAPTDDFGLVGPRAGAMAPALSLQARAAGRKARLHPLAGATAASRAVRDGRVDVAILDGRLIVKRSRSGAALQVAQRALAAQRTLTRLRALGLTSSQALDALAQRPLPVDVLEPGGRDEDRNRGVLTAGVAILFIALIAYGNTVATSVTEEKSSRIVEVLLTTLSPRRLLAGKVLGVGLLGLAQLIVVGGAGLAAGAIAGGAGLPSGAPGTVALVVCWFVLGYAFYSVAFAAVGVLVSRQEDLQAAITPVTVLMSGAYFGALAAVEDPNGTWAQIAALLPPFAPMVVPTRMVLGNMGLIGLLAAIALELLATILLTMLAARVYENAILRIGAPVGLLVAFRGEAAGGEPRHPGAYGGLQRSGPAVLALLAGAIVLSLGASRPLAILLIAAGLLRIALNRRRAGNPPRPPR
jgi:ABC-2 type transport system permease protein